MSGSRRVLVLGIVLADAENLAGSIAQNLASSRNWTVEQRWVVIGKKPIPGGSLQVCEKLEVGEPKFSILNRILSTITLSDYQYVIFVDDDVELPASFLDAYLELVDKYDFALAQPARTHDSFTDHPFVEQLDGITARQTLFVEIGPVVSMRADALALLTPFDLASPMGWGYDFTWPVAIQRANLKMGIVDAAPVHHRLRKSCTHYGHGETDEQMARYLSGRPHLNKEEAFYIVESFA